MIDIHAHILPYIDDGSESLEDSLKMVEHAYNIGIKHLFVTPHALRTGMKPYKKEELFEQFQQFKHVVQETGIDIALYLGQEITITPKTIQALRNHELVSMNDSDYLLIELPYDEPVSNFYELVHSAKVLEKKLVIAHIERYDYYSVKELLQLKRYPVFFQVNSNSITGHSGSTYQKRAMKLLKNEAVDFVASDVHSFRKYDMDIAYEHVKKNFSEEYAQKLFYENARVFISNHN